MPSPVASPCTEHSPDPLLNPDAPCARCGAPTIRGLNTEYCSVDCEEQAFVEPIRCTACPEPATSLFDALPACDACLAVAQKTWPSGAIEYAKVAALTVFFFSVALTLVSA